MVVGLEPRARLICYGCDRKFKRLRKSPAVLRSLKRRKNVGIHIGSSAFFFGRGYREAVDQIAHYNSDPKIKTRRPLDMRLEKYFGDQTIHYYGDID